MSTWFQRQASAYKNGNDRPLGGYLTLMGVYGAGTAVTAVAARVLGRTSPGRIGPGISPSSPSPPTSSRA